MHWQEMVFMASRSHPIGALTCQLKNLFHLSYSYSPIPLLLLSPTAPHEATIEKYGADRGYEFNQIAGCHLYLSIITYLSWVSSHTSSGGSVSVRQSFHDKGRPLQ